MNLSTTQTAHVALALSPESGAPISHRLTLGPRERTSVPINTVLGGMTAAVSIIVESDVPVAADRTMTWGAPDGGLTLDSGSPAPATTWYFAEGATGPFFHAFLSLLNPGVTPSTATVTYHMSTGATAPKEYIVAPGTRRTVYFNAESLTDAALAPLAIGPVRTTCSRSRFRPTRSTIRAARRATWGSVRRAAATSA
jgi:hypothetical protein